MGPTMKKKSSVIDNHDDSDKVSKLDKALRDGRADAKQEFELQRTLIYTTLSKSYQHMFGQIIFAKWKKVYLPALILDPYSVPPGPVRTMWMEKYEKLKAKDMLDQMIHLIYWYGSKNDSDYYGFVAKSNYYTYEQEQAKGSKGIHTLPTKLLEKRNGNEKLTSVEEDTIRTYQEMDEDLGKDPSDRKRGVLVFQEGYDMLSYDDLEEIDVDDDDDDSSSDSSSSSDDDNDNDNEDTLKKSKVVTNNEDTSKKSKTAVTKKSSKQDSVPIKKKKKLDIQNETKTILEVINDVPKKKKNSTQNKKNDDGDRNSDENNVSKKSKTLTKKKRSRTNVDAEDTLIATTSPEKSKKAKKAVVVDDVTTDVESKKVNMSLTMISDSAAVLSDGIGENDDDDDDDDDDDQSSAEMELDNDDNDNDDDDDKDDLDFVENVVSHQKPTKSKKIKEKKVIAVKKEQKVKTKIDLPKTDKQLKRKETEEFRKCEELYSRLIRKWEVAIKTENIERLRRILTEADGIVNKFCSSFIISYDLSTIIKDTKSVLKNANEDLSQFVALKDKFKTTFETKRLLVPKNYVPPKRSQPPAIIGSVTAATAEPKKDNDSMDVSDHGTKMKARNDSKQLLEESSSSMKNLSQHISKSNSTVRGVPSTSAVGSGTMLNNTAVVRPSVSTSNTMPKFKSLLGNIIQQQQRLTSSQSSSNVRDVIKATTASTTILLEQVPLWATTEKLIVELSPMQPFYDTRSLALEFLTQMTQQFPVSTINIDAMSRSMEDAIYQWAQNNHSIGSITGDEQNSSASSWTKIYWRKVHAIVAAFCGGKQEKGTFYTMLLQGKFDTPNKIVNASNDKYVASFEGKVVSL